MVGYQGPDYDDRGRRVGRDEDMCADSGKRMGYEVRGPAETHVTLTAQNEVVGIAQAVLAVALVHVDTEVLNDDASRYSASGS